MHAIDAATSPTSPSTALANFGGPSPAVVTLARCDATLLASAFERERRSHPSTLRRWLLGTALAGAAGSMLLLSAPRSPVASSPAIGAPAASVQRARVVLAPIVLADFAAETEPEPAPFPAREAPAPVPLTAEAALEPTTVRHTRAPGRRALRAPPRSKTSLPAPAVSGEHASRRFQQQMRAGELAFRRGDFEKALTHYSRAARIDAENADASFGVALAAVELHRDDLGYRAAFRTLRLDPDHALGNLLTGYLMQTYGEPEEAIRAYTRYLEVEPEGRFAVEVRALLKSMRGPLYANR